AAGLVQVQANAAAPLSAPLAVAARGITLAAVGVRHLGNRTADAGLGGALIEAVRGEIGVGETVAHRRAVLDAVLEDEERALNVVLTGRPGAVDPGARAVEDHGAFDAVTRSVAAARRARAAARAAATIGVAAAAAVVTAEGEKARSQQHH